MIAKLALNSFLKRNRVDRTTWEKSNCVWEDLVAIGVDHESHMPMLQESAELFARVIQKFGGVHSVRWRVKDVEHLLSKIIRKRAEGRETYKTISQSNYYEIVTDLVGLRALHLFKDNCFEIDSQIRSSWSLSETPVVFVRAGDPTTWNAAFMERNFSIEEHPAGYRSVHYVVESRPLMRKVLTEVQVRTIFEEGWSEIDHTIRYPNFSDYELVNYFLTIFNRLAGSADEMGGFVQGLAATLTASKTQLAATTREKDAALLAMEKLVGELEAAKQQTAESSKTLVSLRAEIDKLRKSSTSLVDLVGKADFASAPVQPDFLTRLSPAALGGLNALERAARDLNSSQSRLEAALLDSSFAKLQSTASSALLDSSIAKLQSTASSALLDSSLTRLQSAASTARLEFPQGLKPPGKT